MGPSSPLLYQGECAEDTPSQTVFLLLGSRGFNLVSPIANVQYKIQTKYVVKPLRDIGHTRHILRHDHPSYRMVDRRTSTCVQQVHYYPTQDVFRNNRGTGSWVWHVTQPAHNHSSACRSGNSILVGVSIPSSKLVLYAPTYLIWCSYLI